MGDATSPRGYVNFGRFLDGYLHQDFRAEHGTYRGAARAFRADASAEEAAAVLAEVEAFLAWAGMVPPRLWQEALANLGGSWRPRSVRSLRALARALLAETP